MPNDAPMIFIPADTLASDHAYKLISGAVTPRPIAWVSTLNPEGKVNLAPFSSYTFVTYDPPKIVLSIGPGTETLKDTLANIKARGEFVINAVTPELVPVMAETSRRYDGDVSEAELLGIALQPGRLIATPRVELSPLAMECRLERIIDLDDRDAHRLVIGQVAAFHVSEAILAGDRIDSLKYLTVGRIGGPLYVTRGETLRAEAGRLPLAK